MNKGDGSDPDYRSRLVAKEIKTDKRQDLFAATPPIEALRILMSMAVTQGIGYSDRRESGMNIDVIDFKRAYLSVKTSRDIIVQLPDEDYEPGMCAKLNKAMYGTRDAAYIWEDEYMGLMRSIGLAPGVSPPCIF